MATLSYSYHGTHPLGVPGAPEGGQVLENAVNRYDDAVDNDYDDGVKKKKTRGTGS